MSATSQGLNLSLNAGVKTGSASVSYSQSPPGPSCHPVFLLISNLSSRGSSDHLRPPSRRFAAAKSPRLLSVVRANCFAPRGPTIEAINGFMIVSFSTLLCLSPTASCTVLCSSPSSCGRPPASLSSSPYHLAPFFRGVVLAPRHDGDSEDRVGDLVGREEVRHVSVCHKSSLSSPSV